MSRLITIVSPLDYSGMAYYSHSLAQALAEHGQRVSLITVAPRNVIDVPCSYEILPFFRGTFGDIPRWQKACRYILGGIQCVSHMISKRPDVIHFQKMDFLPVDILLFVAARIFAKKSVYTPHDLGGFGSRTGVGFSGLLFRLSKRIILHNKENLDRLCDLFPECSRKSSIIAHGNYEFFLKGGEKAAMRQDLGLPRDGKILMIFGNLREGKGIHLAFDAAKLLHEKGLGFSLLIVGKRSRGFDIESLLAYAEANGFANKILLREGFVDDCNVEKYYRACDILLVPYEKCYESGVLRYGFSCGTPTIVSDMAEFAQDVVNNYNALTFCTSNAESLAQLLEKSLYDTELLRIVGENAYNHSLIHWGWKEIARQTYESSYGLSHDHESC